MPDTLIPDLLGDPVRLAILGTVFLGVVGVLTSAVYAILTKTSVVQDRLERSVSSVAPTESGPVAFDGAPSPARARTPLGRMVDAVSRVARPREEAEVVGLRGRLGHAGLRKESALTLYLVAQIVLCINGGLVAVWTNGSMAVYPERAAIVIILSMAVGFYLPPFWLRGRISERQSAINHALPDALDLTITCVEAGIGVDAALDRVSSEVGLSASVLSDELAQTSLEIRAGIPRSDAFRRLANRTGVEELRGLAAVIVQTELFGTSIAQSLRIQADSLRIRRTFVAEERAGKVAVKLTIPLILCILPALLSVLVGPAVVSIVRTLLPTLGGR